jgi:hypothetical protein
MTMRMRLIVSAAIVMFVALVPLHAHTSSKLTPRALIADLYQAHNHKRGPFFQTRSRARLYQYFEKDLADLIWKDADTSKKKNEVGVIDGDPLYDAQDMEIKNFSIGKAKSEGGNASVDVSFENFGEMKTITFLLVNGKSGWRIHDIVYGGGRTLRSQFKEAGE